MRLTCGLALVLLIMAACAAAPKPRPAAPLPLTSAQPPPARAAAGQTPATAPQGPQVVRTQVAVPIEPVAPMAPAAPLAPWTLPGPVPVLPVPDDGYRDEWGRPILREVPKSEPKPDGQTPEQPKAPSPETKPAPPVVVKPEEFQAPERESEEASRKRTERPPKPNSADIGERHWKPPYPDAPRYLPCRFVGIGGPGPSKPEKAPLDWVRCAYRCGKYEVELNDIRLKKDADGKPEDAKIRCGDWINLKRAEQYARSLDDALKARGK